MFLGICYNGLQIILATGERICIRGCISPWLKILAGVPQGSILGSTLFLIYINDIINGIKSNIRLFADDTSLFKIVECPITAALELNLNLKLKHLGQPLAC